MLKRILIGLCLIFMFGFFSIGCESPPENEDVGQSQGYEQKAPDKNIYQKEPGQQNGGEMD